MGKISGVYKITNEENGKYYIGSSNNINTRWVTHRKQLNNGTHNNAKLQGGWNKYGEKSFMFGVVLECDERDILDEEQKELDKAWGIDGRTIYNIAKNTTAPMTGVASPMKGKHHTPKTCNQMSETHKGMTSPNKGNKLSLEARLKMSEDRRGEKGSFWGRKHKKSTLIKISIASKGRPSAMKDKKHTKDSLIKMSISHRGKKASPETRAKMSIASTGRKHTVETLQKMSDKSPNKRAAAQLDITNEFIKYYSAASIATRETGVDTSGIIKACKGKYKTAGGYKWMYLDEYNKSALIV